jgi:hypothetical protein
MEFGIVFRWQPSSQNRPSAHQGACQGLNVQPSGPATRKQPALGIERAVKKF